MKLSHGTPLLFVFLLLTAGLNQVFSAHLVGGDITYQCLGKNMNGLNLYAISVNVYKDCEGTPQFPVGNTPFDQTIRIRIFDGVTLGFVQEVRANFRDSVILDLSSSDSCVAPPQNICYAFTQYRVTVALPDNPNGYHVTWSRCCRNGSIRNIINPDGSGMVLSAFIPNTDLCNNSPRFVNELPTHICLNENFRFDHSATDIDGDSLAYELSIPWTAGDRLDPIPTPLPPPHAPVSFLPPYTISNPMGGNPQLAVNRYSGLMTVRPNSLGQFVFSLTVKEYRNGFLISEVKRDIQINVIPCPINFPPDVVRPNTPQLVKDTLIFYRGINSCFPFTVTDINGIDVPEDNLEIDVQGEIFNPAFGATFNDTSGFSPIIGTVCWTPSCETGDIPDNRIIIIAKDANDCPGPNITYDTLYVKVAPAIAIPPTPKCVSTLDPNTVEISWDPIPRSDREGFAGYYLSRLVNSTWTVVDIISDPAVTSFIDTLNFNVGSQKVCYRLQTAKNCPEFFLGDPSPEVCTTSDEQLEVCRVSVEDSTGAVSLNWVNLDLTSIVSIRIYRRSDNESSFSLQEEISDLTIEEWTDTRANSGSASYCYMISLVDGCGAEITVREHCTVFLQVEENNDRLELKWKRYRGWESGVSGYDVYEIPEFGDPILLGSTLGSTSNFTTGTAPLNQGKYCYQIRAIEAGNGCGIESFSNIDCYVFDPRIFIPNAFTPNNDGHNDLFIINGGFFQSFQMDIFNRWGELIFSTQSIENPWDGTYKGRPAPEGVYVFRMQAVDADGRLTQRAGSVTVLR
ncbi:MAG: gliding motility-associated C-terminal domain-containing protein [Bacteroidia bacterium]